MIFLKSHQFSLQIHWGFVVYAEIQDGHQKWQENDFWETFPVHSLYNLEGGGGGVKHFVEFPLSCTISEIFKIFSFQR